MNSTATVTTTTTVSGLQCSFCGSDKDLQRCGRCFSAQYCSKEHQKLHWKTHKKACKASDDQSGGGESTGVHNSSIKTTTTASLSPSGSSHSMNRVDGVAGQEQDSGKVFSKKSKKKTKTASTPAVNCTSGLTGGVAGEPERDSDNTENRAPDSGPNPNVLGMEAALRGHHIASPMLSGANGSADKPSTPSISICHRDFSDDPVMRKLQISMRVIQDLNKYGICVIDNLLGEKLGGDVSDEVINLHKSGAFQDGQVVREHKENGASKPTSIRGDKITWVEKREDGCEHITSLIELVDTIIMQACQITKGKLGNYTINGRTKAMIACYPGSGTKYVKHVDNPNKDGRCVTAIYYLNKGWNTKVDGGLLRIFPEGFPTGVADIEPIFDRLLFFWSDRRNPHEVQPAFRMRYALTLWYYDAEEKKEADARSRQSQSIQHFS